MNKKIRKFQIALDEQQLRILVDGLHKLPGSKCMPLLGSIREQIAAQIQASQRVVK